MGNDLISRNAVIAIIEKKRLMVGKHDLSAEYKLAGVQEEIEKLPTAYDADKVVEQLEQGSQNIELIYPTDQGYDYEDAIGIDINRAKQIVKCGGIE